MTALKEKVKLNHLNVKPHNIVFAYTTEQDYEMSRYILLTDLSSVLPEMKGDDYLLLEGGHCSCYDFDETAWDATIYSLDELKKLAASDYNKGRFFWRMVERY